MRVLTESCWVVITTSLRLQIKAQRMRMITRNKRAFLVRLVNSWARVARDRLMHRWERWFDVLQPGQDVKTISE